jgi:hypothetical protein
MISRIVTRRPVFFIILCFFTALYGLTGLSESAFATSTSTSSYSNFGKVLGQGSIQNSVVGPATTASGQAFYMNYTYINGTMDFVVVNPDNGTQQIYTSPVAGEMAAWALTVGSDNNMYIGTLPHAHIMKFDTRANKLSDVGTVPADPASKTLQTYIWQMTTSPYNGKIYACTYPSADLVSYDPQSALPQIVNLGTMDTSHQDLYAHYCVADPNPQSPYIYVGLGSVVSKIVAYNVNTNHIDFEISTPSTGFGDVYMATDGHIHGLLDGPNRQSYLLHDNTYTLETRALSAAPTNVFKDGRTINVNSTTITVVSPDKSIKTYQNTYVGKELFVFRMGMGPDGKIYGGTAMPYNFFSLDPRLGAASISMKGYAGDGQPYSLLSYNAQLYIATYASAAPLGKYIPAQTSSSPVSVTSGIPSDLRPQAMIGAPNQNIYIGSTASYGKLTGPLLIWNTLHSVMQTYYPAQNQGVSSLTLSASKCQGSNTNFCVIGGTTVIGGGGSVPSTTAGQLFSWNPVTNTVIHRYALPNVPNFETITDLLTDPSTGYVYGIATSASKESYVFIFNPKTGKFINGGTRLPFTSILYNSTTIYKGKIWGLSSRGVFSINLKNVNQASLFASSVVITSGFALNGNTIYFGSNGDVWSYKMA